MKKKSKTEAKRLKQETLVLKPCKKRIVTNLYKKLGKSPNKIF